MESLAQEPSEYADNNRPHGLTSSQLTVANQAGEPLPSVLSDIGCWPRCMTDKNRVFVVEAGPQRITDYDFPLDKRGRHFSPFYYSRRLCNGETVDCRWLVYSKQCDRVYCFSCLLFAGSKNKFATEGLADWKHLSELIRDHEKSAQHIQAVCQWLDMETRLRLCQTIDIDLQKQIDAEKLHWRCVLERLLTIVNFLASRNLAVRGSSDKLGDPNNGNFLGLVEIMAKFDPVLCEHIRRIKDEEICDHYLGKQYKMSSYN